MLIYNTTYQMDVNEARNFVIYIHNQFIPTALAQGDLKNARLARILSHKDPESECFSLQFEAESTADIHRWLIEKGNKLNEDMLKVFNNQIVGFSTIMEVIE